MRVEKLIAAATIGTILVLPATAAVAPHEASVGDYSGGGTVNAVVARGGSSATDQELFAGGDTQGFWRSTNGGNNWSPANGGLTSSWQRKVASMIRLPAGGPVLAAVGEATTKTTGSQAGGLLYWHASNNRWQSALSSAEADGITFQGANVGDQNGVLPEDRLPTNHPRSVGHLLATGTVAGTTYLFLGTFKNGVYRCTLAPTAGEAPGISNCTSIGLADGKTYIRGLAFDPNPSGNPRLWVVTYAGPNQSVHRLTSLAGATPTVSTMAGTAGYLEEVAALDGVLVVAGRGGLWTARTSVSATPTPGAAPWVPMPTPAPVDGKEFDDTITALQLSSAGANKVNVVAASCLVVPQCRAKGTPITYQVRKHVVTLPTGSAAPTVTDPIDLISERLKAFPSGSPYWIDGTDPPGVLPTGSAWVGNDLFTDAGGRLLAIGRSGIYRRVAAGIASSGAIRPIHQGLGAAFTKRVIVRTQLGQDLVQFTDADWIDVQTGAELADPVMLPMPDLQTTTPGDLVGLDVVQAKSSSGSGSPVVVSSLGGQGWDANYSGRIIVRGPSASVDVHRAPEDHRPVALDARQAYGETGPDTIVAAYVEGTGLKFLTPAGSWTSTTTLDAPPASVKQAEVAWVPGVVSGKDALFVSLPGEGVWRYRFNANLAGLSAGTWDQIASGGAENTLAMSGTGANTVLWMGSGKTIHEYANLLDQAIPSPTIHATLSETGDITALYQRGGQLFTLTQPTANVEGGITRVSTWASPTQDQVMLNASARAALRFPRDLAVSADSKRGYVTTEGQGIYVVSLE